MKIEKSLLAEKLNSIKSIVPSKTPLEAIKGILIKNGCCIATNTETTIQVNLEHYETGEEMILPIDAVNLISSLPDGEINLTVDSDSYAVNIAMKKTRANFASMNPDLFPEINTDLTTADTYTIPAMQLKMCMQSVLFAIAKNDSNKMMSALCMECKDGKLNFVGLDGHVISWNKIDMDGEFKLLIPRNVVEQMMKLNLTVDVEIRYSQLSVEFKTKDFTITSRLIDGAYFAYQQIFDLNDFTTVDVYREEFTKAVKRAALCGKHAAPIIMDFSGNSVDIRIRDVSNSYSEVVPLGTEVENEIRIGMNPMLLINAMDNVNSDIVHISLKGSRTPVVITMDESDLMMLVLPVNIGA